MPITYHNTPVDEVLYSPLLLIPGDLCQYLITYSLTFSLLSVFMNHLFDCPGGCIFMTNSSSETGNNNKFCSKFYFMLALWSVL